MEFVHMILELIQRPIVWEIAAPKIELQQTRRSSMSSNTEIVKKLYDACKQKDFETARKLLHPNYSLKDPVMQVNNADEFIEMMQACPGGDFEDLKFVAEGDKVVGIFTGIMNEPVPSRLRMCSVATVENGKVRSEEMFYDTAQLPDEMLDMMKKSIPGKKESRASIN
jgi:ketosteroid isomerase-like protein